MLDDLSDYFNEDRLFGYYDDAFDLFIKHAEENIYLTFDLSIEEYILKRRYTTKYSIKARIKTSRSPGIGEQIRIYKHVL